MSEPLKLYIAERDDFSPAVMNMLAAHFAIQPLTPERSLADILQETDVFWFRLGYQINASVLNEGSGCKFLVTPVTGIDHIDEDLCRRLGVRIICLRGEYEFLKQVRATAEHTIALTLALLRNIAPAIAHTQTGGWQRDLFRGQELLGKKVGIVGLGRLGRIVADYFHCFGCETGYFDPNVPASASTTLRACNSLGELLHSSDIVSIHVNYTRENHLFFDAGCFEQMKNSAYLINTARGGLIDEAALLYALETGKISGAALDVLWGEPDVEHNALIQYSSTHPNLIITPHIGGNTFESFEKTEQFIAQKLLEALRPPIALS